MDKRRYHKIFWIEFNGNIYQNFRGCDWNYVWAKFIALNANLREEWNKWSKHSSQDRKITGKQGQIKIKIKINQQIGFRLGLVGYLLYLSVSIWGQVYIFSIRKRRSS